MWMPGALIGGLLAYQVYSDAWASGAAIGALAGLVVGRMLARPPGERRLSEVETRFSELAARLDWIDRRLGALEHGEQAEPAAAAPAAEPQRESAPVEPSVPPVEIVPPTTEPVAGAPPTAPAAEPAPSLDPVFTKALRD